MRPAAFAGWLSFGVGFLSLSQEILFVRLVSFAFESTPEAFAFVLVCFLLGIALGAHIGKRVCARGVDLVSAACAVLFVAGTLDALIPRLAAALLPWLYAPAGIALLVVVSAALKSILFPIAHQLGTDVQGPRIGTSLSRVYAANIAGSTLGPLLTGFVLLDYVGIERAFTIVAMGTFVLAASFLFTHRVAALSAGIAGLALTALFAWALPSNLLESIIALHAREGQKPGSIIETRSGIVHTLLAPSGGDIVFGGNVYDGRINTSLTINSNSIERAYVLAALHPSPQRVLVIGMSSGAWTWVVARFPGVREIDVVEINAGYLELIRAQPAVADLLADPRIRISIDDGRRWLLRHPEARYDLVVMNTTYHWRAYSTNLLSRQFLTLVRGHLNPGGILTFNTTYSPDALWTASQVFPFTRLYLNFAYASDHDFTRAVPELAERVWRIGGAGSPLLDPGKPLDRAAVHAMLRRPFSTPEQIARHQPRPLEVITDENMLTEYRYGRPNRLIPGL